MDVLMSSSLLSLYELKAFMAVLVYCYNGKATCQRAKPLHLHGYHVASGVRQRRQGNFLDGKSK
jgi:hypothetical protein